MLEMGFLVFSYLKTVGVKSPGLKKIFSILSDTLMNSVHANEGYRHSLSQQLDLNNITDYFVHTLLVGAVHWCWDIRQAKSVCMQPL